jgi:hypothetical protein
MGKHLFPRPGSFGRSSLPSARSLPVAADVLPVSTTAPVQGRVTRTEIHRYPDQSAALVRINGHNQVVGRLHLFPSELRQVVDDLLTFLDGD